MRMTREPHPGGYKQPLVLDEYDVDPVPVSCLGAAYDVSAVARPSHWRAAHRGMREYLGKLAEATS